MKLYVVYVTVTAARAVITSGPRLCNLCDIEFNISSAWLLMNLIFNKKFVRILLQRNTIFLYLHKSFYYFLKITRRFHGIIGL